MVEQFKYTNRLINEKSPYLLQHAHNPVDWYPWGEEAFNAAKELDKPIFLSVGYATCHWCHVMEKESFESLDIAQMMNENFINIKVDREELPEVDALYMEFAQSMMSGAAGWPLNVILTPDLQPFFAATYLPPVARHGLMGLTELIQRIHDVWSSDEREKVITQAEKIVEVFSDSVHLKGEVIPDKELIEATAELLYKLADPVWGGMKGIPKFPIGYQSNFMLREAYMTNDSRALFLVERTLDMMQRGGIYDHLGGGFARYSVDEKWLVPHFEKMLYDNALLAFSYLETWQACKRDLFKEVCKDIIRYVLKDMTLPEGGFCSAEDADTEGKEGFFYTWDYQEVRHILGQEESEFFCEFYGLTPEGNFEERNILHTPERLEEFAAHKGIDPGIMETLLDEQRRILCEEREKRVRPFKDDKVLSSWNGLMIFALAEAGKAFNEPQYTEAAIKAATFIRANMWKDGILLRRWRGGEALYHAGLDEYAFMIHGLLSLFETGQGSEWLEWAVKMADILNAKFKSPEGAFYLTDGDDINLLLRKCQYSDGAEPSGNAVHCENLLRLYQLTGNPHYLDQAEDILRAVRKFIDAYSPGYCYHMIALNHYYDRKAPTIVIALNEKEHHLNELYHHLYSTFIPHKAVIVRRHNDEELFRLIPSIRAQTPIEGKTTLYICREGVCDAPITKFEQMVEAINKL